MNWKKIAITFAVALVLFFLVTKPAQAAGLVHTVVDFLRSAAESIIVFVSNVFG
jgi:hypothetical protein